MLINKVGAPRKSDGRVTILPAKLRGFMNKLGLGSTALAEALELPRHTVADWMRGRNRPSLSQFLLLSGYLRGRGIPSPEKAIRK